MEKGKPRGAATSSLSREKVLARGWRFSAKDRSALGSACVGDDGACHRGHPHQRGLLQEWKAKVWFHRKTKFKQQFYDSIGS